MGHRRPMGTGGPWPIAQKTGEWAMGHNVGPHIIGLVPCVMSGPSMLFGSIHGPEPLGWTAGHWTQDIGHRRRTGPICLPVKVP